MGDGNLEMYKGLMQDKLIFECGARGGVRPERMTERQLLSQLAKHLNFIPAMADTTAELELLESQLTDMRASRDVDRESFSNRIEHFFRRCESLVDNAETPVEQKRKPKRC